MEWIYDPLPDHVELPPINRDGVPVWSIYAIHDHAKRTMRQMHKGFRRKKKLILRLQKNNKDLDDLATELTKQNLHYLQIIRKFCEEQQWAAQGWKDQPHIKALFDAAEDYS